MCRIVYPDWYVEWIEMWARSFILIGMWNRLSCGLMMGSLRGLTCSNPDRYVVSPVSIPDRYVVSYAAFLIVTWSHLNIHDRYVVSPVSILDRYVVSPVAFLITTWSHLLVFQIVTEATEQGGLS